MIYEVGTDTRVKDKVIGGIFTITQLVFLILAFIVAVSIILLFNSVIGIIASAVIGVIAGGVFLPFAFITVDKMGGIELASYLLYKFRFKHSQKVFYHYNENYKGRRAG